MLDEAAQEYEAIARERQELAELLPWLWEHLPKCLVECLPNTGNGTPERQMLEIISQVVVSGVLPWRVKFFDHEGKERWLPISLYVCGPSGAGKGNMKDSVELFQKGHAQRLKDRSAEERQKAQQAHKQWAAFQSEKKKPTGKKAAPDETAAPAGEGSSFPYGTEPKVPEIQHVLFSGSTTKLGLIKEMRNYKDWPVLIAITEADAITKNRSHKEDMKVIMRNLPSGETIGNNSVSNGFMEISNPKGSWMISGTPGQTVNLFESCDDGTANRCFYICLPGNNKYNYGEDIDDSGHKIEDNKARRIQRFAALSIYMENLTATVHFPILIRKQIAEFIKGEINKHALKGSEAINNYNRRMIEKFYQFSGIMAVLFASDNHLPTFCEQDISVTEREIEIGIKLFPYLNEQAYKVLSMLPDTSKPINKTNHKLREEFLRILPCTFSTNQAVEIATQRNICERSSVFSTIKSWMDFNLISRTGHGKYKKANC